MKGNSTISTHGTRVVCVSTNELSASSHRLRSLWRSLASVLQFLVWIKTARRSLDIVRFSHLSLVSGYRAHDLAQSKKKCQEVIRFYLSHSTKAADNVAGFRMYVSASWAEAPGAWHRSLNACAYNWVRVWNSLPQTVHLTRGSRWRSWVWEYQLA